LAGNHLDRISVIDQEQRRGLQAKGDWLALSFPMISMA